MKGEESEFGKVVLWKGIVNDWRSNGWGCGEPSIRAPENEVRIKANVYLRALFAFETLNGLIPSQQYIVTRKGSFFAPPPGQAACPGERHLVFLLWWRWHFGKCFCQRWSFDSHCSLSQTLVNAEHLPYVALWGCGGFFWSCCTAVPPALTVMSQMTFTGILIKSFMIKKGQAMQGQGSDTVYLSFTQSP